MLVLITALIAGCKTTVETEVNLSDLLDSPTKQLAGNLLVEVPACQSHEDSRQPSEVLLEVQKVVPSVFSDAKYSECYRKGFDSFARFSIPIVLNKNPDQKLVSESQINLLSTDRELLKVAVPDSIRAKLAKAQKKSPVGNLDLKFVIGVKNDTGKDVLLGAVAVFVDQVPFVSRGFSVKPKGAFRLTLSDVSARSALDGNPALVLFPVQQ